MSKETAKPSVPVKSKLIMPPHRNDKPRLKVEREGQTKPAAAKAAPPSQA